MLGAFVAWFLLEKAGIGYWGALLAAPVAVGIFGAILERLFLRRIAGLDPLYGLLLTFGIALVLQGLFSNWFGSSGLPYEMPRQLEGGQALGFMFLPNYRVWVIAVSLVICLGTWTVIERTRLGSVLRAATENAALVSAFGINVPRLITITYAPGVSLPPLPVLLPPPTSPSTPLLRP